MLLLAQLPMGAANISYNECSWNSSTNTVDITQKSRDMSALPDPGNDWIGLGNGWYYVTGNKSCQTVNILGNDVNLVLCDGAQLTCTGGVKLEGPNRKLTIYSQSTGSQEGKLVVTQSYDGAAGIGCAANCEDDNGNIIGMGTLIIHGGDISASGSSRGAAIGGGKNRGLSGPLTIYGGKVKAGIDTAIKHLGAGIGGGWGGSQGADIYIYGGEVTAKGKGYGDDGGAGIGGGGGSSSEGGAGGTIKIYGGTVKAYSQYAGGGAAIGGGSQHTFNEITIAGGLVTAECENKELNGTRFEARGAAIGSGYDCDQLSGRIYITGGIVMAKGLTGAGIGGGYKGDGGDVNISNGTVIATSEEGAGIGGGYKGNGGYVNISGGNVTAYSSLYGAGIGGGNDADGGTVTVTGGHVTAVGGAIHVDWFKDHNPDLYAWKANPSNKYSFPLDLLSWIIVGAIKSGTYYGAGIGGGDDGKGGTVIITGGTVHAMGGNTDAPGIGAGRKGGQKGRLSLGDNLMVFTGDTDKYGNYRTTDRLDKAHSQFNVYISDKYVPLSSYGVHASDLSALNGQKKSVMLTWRKFLCGGQYNTLCLPFKVSKLEGTPLEGAKIYTVKSSKIENKILILELQDAPHKIDAGVPYVVKWEKPSDYYQDRSKYDTETIIFEDVTIDASAPKRVELDNGTFSGAYDNVVFSQLDSAQVVFKENCKASPAYTGYSLRSLACNFKGKGSSKFGWEKGNYEQIMFSHHGNLDTGANIHYTTHTWDAATGTLEQFDCICPEVKYITETLPDDWYALNQNQWYVVSYAYTKRKAIEVHDNAYLILTDNADLSLTGGLKVEYGKSLHIYAQTPDSYKTGALTITQSYEWTAALGSAGNHSFGTVGIHGGVINVTGTDESAAIGPGPGYEEDLGGIPYYDPNEGNLYIYGGEITARGGKNAAGIGCSYASSKLDVYIYGGTVQAYGGEDGAGIGGAYCGYRDCRRGHTTIYGGIVEATAGPGCVGRDAKKGSAIGAGRGDSDKDHGLTIAKSAVNLKVSAGDAANNIERVFTDGEREPACHWRNYAKIEPCHHDDTGALSYTVIDDDSHQVRCKYCGYESTEPHDFDNTTHKCACGKVKEVKPETWTVSIYSARGGGFTTYDEPYKRKVVKGEKFTIPTCYIPSGLIFMQWMCNPTTAPGNFEMKDAEFDPNTIYVTGYEFEPSSDINLYARYRYDSWEKWTWNADGAPEDVSATVEVDLANGQRTGVLPATIVRNYYEADGDNPAFIRYIATASFKRDDGVTYNFSDLLDRNALPELILSDNGDNNDRIDKNNYALVEHVKLEGRTLYKDGKWNTLCLPFDVEDSDVDDDHPASTGGRDGKTFTGTPLEGAKVVTIDNATIASRKLSFEFSAPQQTMNAGKPYLVKWETVGDNIVEPVFSDVIINSQLSPVNAGAVRFMGIFNPTVLPAGSRDILYVGVDGKLYYPDADVTLGAFRAYFEVMLGGNGTPFTGISEVYSKAEAVGDSCYDLQGRKVQHPAKGLYIINGKKTVVK